MDRSNLTKDIYHLRRENNLHRQHAITFSCLGKLGSANHPELHRWKRYLQILIRESLNERSVSQYPFIIGLAESGIVPSALFHQLLREQGIHAGWICSTRRPSRGIHFRESHSHGPDHILPLPSRQPTELWFVDDEITTGRTLLRLALNLCRMTDVRQVRFFAIADTRSFSHAGQFGPILENHGIAHSVHTLVQLKQRNGGDQNAGTLLEDSHQEIRMSVPDETPESDWHFPRQRPGLRNQSDTPVLFSDSLPIRINGKGSILVVGEAVDIALRLVQLNPLLSFRHVTLSPWETDHINIFSRLDIFGKYYLYNYHDLSPPLHILSDPIDSEIGTEVGRLLAEKGFRVEHDVSK
ncbi:phosphoribosyltransferase domain-containing protein [Desulfobacterales bacterium HSG2]|nr:phosphoribosyltransferase domain-containing protein [Desulfobacterales bacterium HSG2]